MASDSDQYRWTVIGQRQTTGRLPDGTIGDVVEVTFKLYNSGTVARVDVPVQGFSVAKVGEAIDAYADQLDAVHGLQG